jgi:hypothetical protein
MVKNAFISSSQCSLIRNHRMIWMKIVKKKNYSEEIIILNFKFRWKMTSFDVNNHLRDE